MNGNIFILNDQNELIEMQEVAYESENLLQKLLDDYPNLLAGDQIAPDGNLRWLPISREIGVPSAAGGGSQWYLDHLFIDNYGVPTFVEVKRSTDTRIRREVVGQMLDYAANATEYWPIEDVRSAYQSRCIEHGLDPNEYFIEIMGIDADADAFWRTVAENLNSGKIRMLFVADHIPNELQRIIEFLNDQMIKSEVLGIEVHQYANGNMKTLVPRVIGLTSKGLEIKRGQPSHGKWDETRFMADVEKRFGAEAVSVYADVLRLFEGMPVRIWWGNGKKYGGFVPTYDGKQSHQLLEVWSNGYFELYFQHYKAPFDTLAMREWLKKTLEDSLGIQIPADKLDGRPSYSWKILKDSKIRENLEKCFTWYLEQVKEYEAKL